MRSLFLALVLTVGLVGPVSAAVLVTTDVEYQALKTRVAAAEAAVAAIQAQITAAQAASVNIAPQLQAFSAALKTIAAQIDAVITPTP